MHTGELCVPENTSRVGCIYEPHRVSVENLIAVLHQLKRRTPNRSLRYRSRSSAEPWAVGAAGASRRCMAG